MGAASGDRPSTVSTASQLLHSTGTSVTAKTVAPIIDGKGGGRPESASAGGKEAARLGEAVDAARSAVVERLNGRRG